MLKRVFNFFNGYFDPTPAEMDKIMAARPTHVTFYEWVKFKFGGK